jgi:hypothetical protein
MPDSSHTPGYDGVSITTWEDVKKKIDTAMREFQAAFPDHQITLNYFNGITASKHQVYVDMTDKSGLILPSDTYEIPYTQMVPVINQRGCGNKFPCPGCKTRGDQIYERTQEEVIGQLEKYQELYPNADPLALMIGGENPFRNPNTDLIGIMEEAYRRFNFDGNPSRLGLQPEDFCDVEGFAYIFAGMNWLQDTSVIGTLRESKDAGMRRLNIGVESMIPQVLAQHFRKQTVDDIKRGLENARTAGIEKNISMQVILGFNEDYDEENAHETANQLNIAGYDGRVFLARFKKGCEALKHAPGYKKADQKSSSDDPPTIEGFYRFFDQNGFFTSYVFLFADYLEERASYMP